MWFNGQQPGFMGPSVPSWGGAWALVGQRVCLKLLFTSLWSAAAADSDILWIP